MNQIFQEVKQQVLQTITIEIPGFRKKPGTNIDEVHGKIEIIKESIVQDRQKLLKENTDRRGKKIKTRPIQ